MGPIWGQQDPGGPHVGPMNFAIWEVNLGSENGLTLPSNKPLSEQILTIAEKYGKAHIL